MDSTNMGLTKKDKYLLDCIQTYKRRLVWSIQADNRCKMQEKILTFQMYKNFLLFGKQYEKKWRYAGYPTHKNHSAIHSCHHKHNDAGIFSVD